MNTSFSTSALPTTTTAASFEHVFDGVDESGLLFTVTINGAVMLLSLLVCCVRHRHSHEAVWRVLALSDKATLHRAGTDGYLYLKFFSGLGLLHLVCAVLACGVLLPVHMAAGDAKGSGVRQTSSANLVGSSTAWLWVHVAVVFAVSVAVYAFAWRFRRLRRATLDQHRAQLMAATLDTVWLRGLPRSGGDVSEERVREWFAAHWPELRLRDVQVVTDTRELAALYDRYERCSKSSSHLADAERARLEAQLRLKLGAGLRCAGHAFVQMVDRQLALDFLRRDWATRVRAATDVESRALGVANWTLHEATSPGNILWENLDVSRTEHVVRLVLVNALIVVLASFFTTPTAIWSGLTSISSVAEWLRSWESSLSRSSIVFEYAPSLLLATVSMILPYLVLLSTLAEKHKTKSTQENVRLRKTFVFLVFYGLMLPSAALNSVESFVRLLSSDPTQLSLLFPPDQGVVFTNYVVHVAFLFLSFDLARPHEWSHTPDRIYDFGLNLSWNLLLFVITLVYSTLFPLISVAGFVCFVLRYLLDKYYLCSLRSKQFDSNAMVLTTATHYVVVSVLIYQLAAMLLCLNFGATAQLAVIGIFPTFLAAYVGWLTWRWRRQVRLDRQRREELLANWHPERIASDDELLRGEQDKRVYENPVVTKVNELLQRLNKERSDGVELEDEAADRETESDQA